jgi:hypothetical protein
MVLNEVQRQQKEIGFQQEHIQRLEDEISNERRQNQSLQERLERLEAAIGKTASGAGAQ